MSFEEIAADLEGNEGGGPGGGYEERWEEPVQGIHAGGTDYGYYNDAQFEEEECEGPPEQDAGGELVLPC